MDEMMEGELYEAYRDDDASWAHEMEDRHEADDHDECDICQDIEMEDRFTYPEDEWDDDLYYDPYSSDADWDEGF